MIWAAEQRVALSLYQVSAAEIDSLLVKQALATASRAGQACDYAEIVSREYTDEWVDLRAEAGQS
jgi:hypothetical protein